MTQLSYEQARHQYAAVLTALSDAAAAHPDGFDRIRVGANVWEQYRNYYFEQPDYLRFTTPDTAALGGLPYRWRPLVLDDALPPDEIVVEALKALKTTPENRK